MLRTSTRVTVENAWMMDDLKAGASECHRHHHIGDECHSHLIDDAVDRDGSVSQSQAQPIFESDRKSEFYQLRLIHAIG